MPVETKDLFGEPLESRPRNWQAALAKDNLIDLLAYLQLMPRLSAVCRGDNQPAGWTVLTDGLPALFAVGMDHFSRQPLAALAGLIDDPLLESLGQNIPCSLEIKAAMRRIASDAASRFEMAAQLLRSIAGGEL